MRDLGLSACRLQTLEVEVLGSTAHEVGSGEIAIGGGPVPIKYLVVWKREDDAWKRHQDKWNLSA